MLSYLSSGSRSNLLKELNARSGMSSTNASRNVGGSSSMKGTKATGSASRRNAALLVSKYAASVPTTTATVKRYYAAPKPKPGATDKLPSGYTEEDLLYNTVEANGFKILGEKEVKVDVPHWEKMTEAAFNQMRFSDAVEAYEHIRGVGPNAHFMSDLHMRALDSLGGRDDDIIEAYRDMRQRGVKILSASYAKILKALYRRGEKKRVVSIFELMQSEGTPGTPEVYAVLLALYYKENPKDIETALGILETMKTHNVAPDVDVLDRCFLFFAEAGRNDLIQATYKQYIQTGKVKTSRISLCVMAETMLLEGRPAVAHNFVNKVYTLHQYPRLRTYELMIHNYLSVGNKKKADEMLAEMKHSAKYKATLSVYKAFFKFYEKSKDYEGLQETLARMVNETIPPDSDILESMLVVYFDNNKNDEFLATFIQMLDRQMIPARNLWTNRMHVLKADQFTSMVTLLKEYEYMVQAGVDPNEEELRLIVSSMHETSRPDLVEQFAKHDLAKAGIKLDAIDYGLMIRNYDKNGSAPYALETYQKFLTAGLVAAEPHVVMAQILLNRGNNEDALQVFETIKKSVIAGPSSATGFEFADTQPPRLMEAFMTAFGAEAHPFVQQIFDLTIQHSRGAVDVDLFDTSIRFLASTQHIEAALSHYRMMQESFKLGPTRNIYLCLMEGIGRATEAEQTTKHITTMFDLFRTHVSDPAMHPLSPKLVSTFLLFMMRHANHTGFSQAVNFFRILGSQFEFASLGQVEGAALRKWLTETNPEDFVPSQYEARHYEQLSLNLPTDIERQWQARDL